MRRRITTMLVGATVAFTMLARAETVIISPSDEPANPKSAMASDGIELVTSVQTGSVETDDGLLAQFRTWLSATINKLNTFPSNGGLMLLFK